MGKKKHFFRSVSTMTDVEILREIRQWLRPVKELGGYTKPYDPEVTYVFELWEEYLQRKERDDVKKA